HELEQRGLAAAARAHHAHNLVLERLQRQVLERGHRAEAPDDAPYLDGGRRRDWWRLQRDVHRSLRGHYPTGSKGQRRAVYPGGAISAGYPPAPLVCNKGRG